LLPVTRGWAAPGVSRATYEENTESPTLASEQVEPATEPGDEPSDEGSFDEPKTDETTSPSDDTSTNPSTTPSADDSSSSTPSSANATDDSSDDAGDVRSEETTEAQPEHSATEHPGGDVSEPANTEPNANEDDATHPGAGDSGDSGDSADNDDSSKPELIQERYSNRAIKIEREVKQDANGNYVNHGVWKMWDQRGNVIAEGQYQDGERDGTWNRWYRTSEVELLRKMPYQEYTGPFISQATFTEGKLDGKWTIYDAKQHKISEWSFADGHRDGKSIWFYSNGQKMREIDYRDGEIDGQYLEWSPDAKLLVRDVYQGGRRLAKKIAEHNASQRRSEGVFLFAKDVVKTSDDWWNCEPATYEKTGKDEKHGPWTSWYETGQKQMQGEYRNDSPVGKFTWWHVNGQKALEGTYVNGKQHGRWVWWHQNGQKSIQGEYVMGNPTGHWSWWGEDGKVSQAANLSHTEGKVVELPSTKEKDAGSTSRAPARQPRGNFVR